jgi:hypothetical protein
MKLTMDDLDIVTDLAQPIPEDKVELEPAHNVPHWQTYCCRQR